VPGPEDNGGPAVAQVDPSKLPVVAADLAARIKSAARTVPVPQPLAPPGVVPARPIKPGVERWPVKTGADPDAARVGRNEFAGPGSDGIVETTVEELINLPRPSEMSDIHGFQEDFQERRAEPVEFVIWRLKADIIVIKKEADGDLHMVLQGDSGRTMVAEAPTPRSPFVKGNSPWLDAMKQVRKSIAEQFGPSFAAATFQPLDNKLLMPATPIAAPVSGPAAPLAAPPVDIESFEALQPFEAKVPQTPVTVTGVGLFDRVHGQTGVALKNGIELHPVLAIEFE
jgi:hypothetical protein